MNLTPTKAVAAKYGITTRRLLAIAESRGVVGTKRGQALFWTQEQVNLLRPRASGYAGHLRTIVTKQLQQEIEELTNANPSDT